MVFAADVGPAAVQPRPRAGEDRVNDALALCVGHRAAERSRQGQSAACGSVPILLPHVFLDVSSDVERAWVVCHEGRQKSVALGA